MQSKNDKAVKIEIIDYPNALQSAVQGLRELFVITNQLAQDFASEVKFDIEIVDPINQLPVSTNGDIVIVPPNLNGSFHLNPSVNLIDYLTTAAKTGAVLCSACAGIFILAETGLLNQKRVTTHWGLADFFQQRYPHIELQKESILINDGDIITAAGMMSWVDLGLELVAQYTGPHIMRQLGRHVIVDTGKREQRYYESFAPKTDHGNSNILQVQHFIQGHYHSQLNVAELARSVNMTERTFLRQFYQSTQLKPKEYIQRVRVQKACQLLEVTTRSFEQIAHEVGYGEANSFRKVFNQVMGLSPSEFRKRFI